MPNAANVVLGVLLAAVAVLAAGCLGKDRTEPSISPSYIDLASLQGWNRRVLIVPLAHETNGPNASPGMTAALVEHIQERRLFQRIVETPVEGADGAPLISGSRPLSLKDLSQIRRQTDCDSVLLGTITSFSSYPNLKIGLHLRLVDLRDSRILWAIQQIWDSSDKATQERIERYFHDKLGESYDPLRWRLATVSPAAFETFVAYEVAQTLPSPKDAPKAASTGH
jgi:hypothetical protein